MIRAINDLPIGWRILAYAVLAWGLIVVVLFLGRYTRKLPWADSPEGRHLVAMSSNIGAFFLVYLVQAIWPEIPGRRYILIGLLLTMVINCTRRWLLLEKHLREPRDTEQQSVVESGSREES